MYISSPRDVGALIRDRRQAKGLTQSALARELGVRQAWVSDLENGKFGSRLDLVLSALKAVNVKLWADIGDRAQLPGATPVDPDKGDDVDLAAVINDMLDEL
jgi:HTH-type transcriptional regulator/antitoxin HipB